MSRKIFLPSLCSLVLATGQVQAESPHCVSSGDTVYNWNPLSPSLTTYNWDDDNHWDGSGIPDSASECAWIADVDPASTCTFNLSSASIGSLRLQGDSPTKMKLYLKDGALTMDDVELYDYADLDLDYNFTVVATTKLEGDVWIDIASSKICDLMDVSVFGTDSDVHATTSGTLAAHNVTIDANALNNHQRLRFTGGGFAVDGTLLVKSAQTSGSYDGKFPLVSGTVNVATPDEANAILELDGGDSASRRAVLDIDGTMTAEQTNILSGNAAIDVASGTSTGGKITISAGGKVSKTGSGAFNSGG